MGDYDDADMRSGPLMGVRVVEFAGIGPGPFAGQLLADLGADVLRVVRPGGIGRHNPVSLRGKSSLTMDIRADEDRARLLGILDHADVLIEGYRPGVMEKRGFAPDELHQRNPRLVYGRMTGWGQAGPLSKVAGHDINYIALTGVLAAMGQDIQPTMPPLNLLGDFGGGSMFLVFGILAALLERERSGRGQVIDAAIVDGVASLMSYFSGLSAVGAMSLDRGRCELSGSAPFYQCYVCADGKQVAVGAIEPHFLKILLDGIGASPELLEGQLDPGSWAERSKVLADIFVSKTQDEWCALLEGTDACLAPVLELGEAHHHPHMIARGTYFNRNGVVQPAPAPRFSRTPCAVAEEEPAAEMIARWMG